MVYWLALLWRKRIIEQNGLFSRNFYYFYLYFYYCKIYNGFTQEVIKANIIVAKDGTLSVKEEIRIILVKIFYYYPNVFI
jgi:hypothetical protein